MGKHIKNQELKNVPGIYRIRNTISGKIYIGSAVSLYNREAKHFSELGLGVHENDGLQNAYNKYGKESLVFEPVELMTFRDKKFLLSREQYYLDTLQPWRRDTGYNIRKIAHSNEGIPLSEESKKKLSLHNKGKKLTEEHKKKIGNANRGKKYSTEYRQKMSERRKGKPLGGKRIKGEENSAAVPYHFISPEGVEYKGVNVNEFCRKMNLPLSKFTSLNTGKTHQTRDGWRVPGREVREHHNAVTLTLLSPDGELVTITNLERFCREHKMSTSKVYEVLKGVYSQHKGWKKPPKTGIEYYQQSLIDINKTN